MSFVAETFKFVLSVFAGLGKAVLTDREVLLMFVFGIAVGFLFGNVWAGIVGFLGIYLPFRMASNYLNALFKFAGPARLINGRDERNPT